jgi:hypothetical protein
MSDRALVFGLLHAASVVSNTNKVTAITRVGMAKERCVTPLATRFYLDGKVADVARLSGELMLPCTRRFNGLWNDLLWKAATCRLFVLLRRRRNIVLRMIRVRVNLTANIVSRQLASMASLNSALNFGSHGSGLRRRAVDAQPIVSS